jgi:hypothetical protein
MKFNCVECHYCCDKLSEWTKHTNTRKHLSRIGVEQKKSPSKFLCGKCDKEYSVRSSLWYHERKCGIERQIEPHSIQTEHEKSPYLDIINKLLADNMELRNFIIEQSKTTADTMNKVIEQANEHNKDTLEIVNKVIENVKPTNNTINGNINNNQTNKFNINLFLNEQCKDAMNFSDFIKNIAVSREDLENNAQLGFVDGVSKILIESLKQLDQTERPIHCTDIKRETMYIKDDDKWNKEEDSSKLNKAIQEVTRKSMISLLDWKEENPDYKDRDSAFSERCIVIQQQSMAAHNRDTFFPKVAKLVAKEVMVDK